VAEWIKKTTLSVCSPRYLVVANLVDGAVRSGRHSPLNECVRVVDEEVAPMALAYHRAAFDASETASITEMTGS